MELVDIQHKQGEFGPLPANVTNRRDQIDLVVCGIKT